MLHKLVFDATDANTIADSHHIGAHTLSGSGSLISSGDGNSDNIANTLEGLDTRSFLFGYDSVGGNWDRLTQTSGALDINVKSGSLVVDLDGIYAALTNATPDTVGSIFHVRAAAPSVTDQTFRSTGGPLADAVVNANVHGIDTNSFGMLYNGTTWDRWQGSSGSANVHITDTTVTVSDAALADVAIAADKTSLTTAGTAQVAIASPLTNRKYLSIYNNDNRTMYIGPATVTAANGFPVPPGSMLEMRAGAAVTINAVSTKSAHDMRYMELS